MPKCERFKSYLKKLYDFLKVNEEALSEHTTSSSSKLESLPELIVDKNLVDNEQIYQQLQLYNNDTSSSIGSLTKFFSKCVVAIDDLSFNVDLKKSAINRELNGSSGGGGGTTDNLEDDDSNNGEDEHYLSDADDDDDDEGVLSDDSVENMLKNSKIKVDIKNKEKSLVNAKNGKKKVAESEFGIPDGSDSEISDFEVNENPNEKDDDAEEEEEEEDDDDEEEEEDNLNVEGEEEDDIDSDEVDEDLVDLYTDLGDEKEVMGIGKPSKSFNQVNFDKEDFGLDNENDQEDGEENGAENDYDNEPDETEKKTIAGKQTKTNDLFNVGESDEDEKKKNETAIKSSFEIRQSKVSENIFYFIFIF